MVSDDLGAGTDSYTGSFECGDYTSWYTSEFASAAATDTSISVYLHFSVPASPKSDPISIIFDSWFLWEIRQTKETVVPTKGHLSAPKHEPRRGYQHLKLKNEFSGRRY